MKRTPLGPLHEARGARWMEYHGWEIPALFSRLEDEYQALQEGCGLVDLSFRGKLRITGRDRRTWLHGQVTQEVNGLADGKVAYATVLTPQGKMVCDMRIMAIEDELIVDVPAGTSAPIPEYLDRYLIMERAEIEDLTETCAMISIQGPQAVNAVGAILGTEPTRLPLWGAMKHEIEGECLYVARVPECGEDGFNLIVHSRCAVPLWTALSRHRPEFAVHSIGWEALNLRRIEAGIPWWGEELGPNLVPLEARLDHAVSMHKGCYVGQEIIARIDARGHVNNLLAGFLVHSDRLPARGAEIHHAGKKVGTVSTATTSLRLNRPIALGFLRRELQEPGTRVEAVTPEGPIELEVTGLPFLPHDYPIATA
ncbi:MAG: Folate-dependent protein for Fe/S cluster synthesis/repair in oxidative stress [Armatimonadetes bacterium]|jgi:folate-binding protein YgfZ|nr:Folate-dependent protein for Fe/S cluster synthesis/repair in oxidative stress [Armatimonadota bacterium]